VPDIGCAATASDPSWIRQRRSLCKLDDRPPRVIAMLSAADGENAPMDVPYPSWSMGR
jgi:hypothetical protein